MGKKRMRDTTCADAVVVRDAVKRYGRMTVLKGVSLTVPRGSICGIIGRNGSGKTVLFRHICGLSDLTRGEIYVDGQRVGKDVDVPPGLGCIIETPGFLEQFSGYRNLKLLADIRGTAHKKDIRETIARVGLDPYSRKPVGKYSLGMRQRLGIAQAIMEGQGILVLDEPMNGLDNRGVEDMRSLFLSLRDEGRTILMASHNREDIEVLCDEVYEMDAGVLVRSQVNYDNN